jgi:hypothetical protein
MKAEQAWELSAILISLEGIPLALFHKPDHNNNFKHGVVTAGSAELTLQQAKTLRDSLNKAIKDYEYLEESCNEYFSNANHN